MSPTACRCCAGPNDCCGQAAPASATPASPATTSTSNNPGGDPMSSTRPSASLGRRLLPAVAMTTAASGLVALLDRPSSGAAVDLGLGAAASQPTTQPAGTAGQPAQQA